MGKDKILEELRLSYNMVLEMIQATESQSTQDYQTYYTLRDGLLALIDSMEDKGFVDTALYEKWNEKVMWWVARVLEEDPLLDKINFIDKAISLKDKRETN